ncbi:MAG TPA: SoxR reducing system RseC family protein [Candidatus Gallibacteroides avistercoris]|uniref:SoxR reducing system RseC family protein n=1 Tax=Candidatus Gallibacteroides avistercoris TaxID=2840833 RepID=A0A9D1M833_9BACT|nr:SoxR reducing system RseC family protein [Candidatus Gallibacteroides avistercoris]
MSQVIEHPGTILTIQNGVARIQITQYAACSGCHARSVCLISDCREKVIEVPCSETSWQAGDAVTVTGSEQMGNKAVRLAFLYPSIILFFVLWFVLHYTENELAAGIAALAALIPYYAALYLFKDKLKKQLVFSIKEP